MIFGHMHCHKAACVRSQAQRSRATPSKRACKPPSVQFADKDGETWKTRCKTLFDASLRFVRLRCGTRQI